MGFVDSCFARSSPAMPASSGPEVGTATVEDTDDWASRDVSAAA
jgi:hypothetical protein